jgi:hypothetical protein
MGLVDSSSAIIDARSRYGQWFALFCRASHSPPFIGFGTLRSHTNSVVISRFCEPSGQGNTFDSLVFSAPEFYDEIEQRLQKTCPHNFPGQDATTAAILTRHEHFTSTEAVEVPT